MNLNIEIDKRNIGKYFHKMPGIKSNKIIKKLAIKDMAEETGEDKFYHKAYLSSESIVLSACDVIIEIIPINTCIL